MSVIEKLKEAVRSVVEERSELYKEARLEDGRVVATEADEFSAGASVRVLSEDGEAAPLEPGAHELSDGGQITIDAESKVEMMEEEEEKVEAQEEPDEMAAVKAALMEKFEISPEVAQEIVEVVTAALKPMVEEEVEASEEPKKEEMSMQVELAEQMATALQSINKRLEALESEPAAEPDRVLPKAEFSQETNPNLSGVDRALNIISQFS
tara:strand:- start:2236 stop:2865 length:630 start_codon:yes stop_codon:yes gene_type:complete